ncbi:hypothetical protein [Deinococcus yavapaiensis]|uniref:Uncharacterized protein n=1 Tax=Deinococcus yavapaiensis KR-236 TaxID=694435 RepID=A0A318RYN4_9DEIO|nr:hypothetical protein [Deinococcus yavapaiensis]PYE48339.1 hypothetical protein DES52_1319 [Deinococcus yavapaiensis KR-236]
MGRFIKILRTAITAQEYWMAVLLWTLVAILWGGLLGEGGWELLWHVTFIVTLYTLFFVSRLWRSSTHLD